MTTAYYRPQPGDVAVWSTPSPFGGGYDHHEAPVTACAEDALVGGLFWAAFVRDTSASADASRPAALALLWTMPWRVWAVVDPADPLPLYRARVPVIGLRADDDRLRCPACRCWRSGDPNVPNSRDFESCDPTNCPCHLDLDPADAIAQYGRATTEPTFELLWRRDR